MNLLDRSLIAELEQFRGIADTDLDYMLQSARSLSIQKDRPIFEQDHPGDSFFLLLHGHVRVVRTTPEGEQVIVRYISAGQLIGMAQALGRTTYPATAIAAVDCVVLAWPSKLWNDFVARIPGFSANTVKTVGGRLEDAHTRVVEMATSQVEQRIAHALLRLAKQSGEKTEEGILIGLPLSRQNIGEMTGTTLHTVSRILSAWETKGLVKSSRQKITIIAPHKLLLLAEGHTEKK